MAHHHLVGLLVGIEFLAVPKFARHLLVFLVEALAVIAVTAQYDLIAKTTAHFLKPIRVGERLSSKPDNIRLTAL